MTFEQTASEAHGYIAKGPIVAWGGDVNLGRRQNHRVVELGAKNVLSIQALWARPGNLAE